MPSRSIHVVTKGRISFFSWLSNIPVYIFIYLFICIYVYIYVYVNLGLPSDSVVKKPPAIAGAAGNVGSVPGLGRPLGGGNGNPLQYSCL